MAPRSDSPIPAWPSPLELSPGRTAVVVVDMQNDFASAGGMFDVRASMLAEFSR